MYIRSQSKKTLIEMTGNAVCIYNNIVHAKFHSGEVINLGTYDSDETCVAILDVIESRMHIKENQDFVYQMPSREEAEEYYKSES